MVGMFEDGRGAMDGRNPARSFSRRAHSPEPTRADGDARVLSPSRAGLLRTGSAHFLTDEEGIVQLPGTGQLSGSANGENASNKYKIYSVVALVALVVVGLVLGRPWEISRRPTEQTSGVHSEQTSSQEVSRPASTAHHFVGRLRSTTSTTAAPSVRIGTSIQIFRVGSTAAATVPESTSTLRPTSKTTSAAAATSRRITSTRLPASTTKSTAPTTTHETTSTIKVTSKTTSTVATTTTHQTTSTSSEKTSKTTAVRATTTPAPLVFTLPEKTTKTTTVQATSTTKASPVLTFYMYRSQSDENYSPENQNMANLGGALWYLHNEIIFTSRWFHNTTAELRSGSKFSVQKTRIERFKVSTRAPKRLYELGMNFGVLHEFDSGRCTGPGQPGVTHPSPENQCKVDYDRYGYTVGCESWKPNAASNYPHPFWNSINHYPGAHWYSLPGSCPQNVWKNKTAACRSKHGGGACRNMAELLSDSSSCTYVYEKEGELSLDELEGLPEGGFHDFVKAGGVEYDRGTDRGTNMTFWDFKNESYFCQKRIDHAKRLFASKYPHSPDLEDPDCNFDMFKFYSTPGEPPEKCEDVKCAVQHSRSFNCSSLSQSWRDEQWKHCCCPKPEVPSIAKCQAHIAELHGCQWTSKLPDGKLGRRLAEHDPKEGKGMKARADKHVNHSLNDESAQAKRQGDPHSHAVVLEPPTCPGQTSHPGARLAPNDGSLKYECCCDMGFWDPRVRNVHARIEFLL